VAVVAAYSALAVPSTDRFSVGAWAGGSATAAVFAGMYAFGWWNDRQHVHETRQVAALHHNRGYVAGLSFGPLLGLISLFLVGITARQQQRRRAGQEPLNYP
jgi:hypothetical protein